MRIAKSQLRRIIREQVAGTTYTPGSPGDASESGTPDEWYDFLMSVIDTEVGDMGSDLMTQGGAIADALEQVRQTIQDEVRGPTR